jgi:hypothetical protein
MKNKTPKSRKASARKRPANSLSSIPDILRQRLHGPSFRIPDPTSLEEYKNYLAECGCPDTTSDQEHLETTEQDSKELLRLIASLATEVWRIQKYFKGNSGQLVDPEDIAKVSRRIQAIVGILKGGSFDIQDYDGQKHVVGLNKVNMVDQIRKTGINYDIIEETIKPSICYKDTLIQRADVIVAVPDKAEIKTQPGSNISADNVSDNSLPPDTETSPKPESHNNINHKDAL